MDGKVGLWLPQLEDISRVWQSDPPEVSKGKYKAQRKQASGEEVAGDEIQF